MKTSERNIIRTSGFSLPDLLVVLVIIGILVLVALPNLMPLISRTKATEAQQLTFLHSLEQKRSTGETFGYDSLNRLTAIGSRQIAYAPNGNITSMGGMGAMSYGVL